MSASSNEERELLNFPRRNQASRRQPRQQSKPLNPPRRQNQPPDAPIRLAARRQKRNGAARPLNPVSLPQPSHPVPSLKTSRQPPRAQAPSAKRLNNRRPRRFSPVVYCARLLILGIGLSAIAGTMLALLDPATRQPVVASTKQESKSKASTEKRSPLALGFAQSLKLSQEITPLKTAVQKITAAYPQLQPGIFLLDLETGGYLNLGGSDTLAAASTIKLPVAVAFFQDFDAGKIRLDEQLTLTTKDIATGSGEMQYKPPGTKFTVLETITKMMTISDNTATNMIINRLGGAEVLNQRFRAWGLTATAIQNRLPDIEGTNTSSARDMANLLAMVAQGDLISMGGRDRLLQIMQRTAINSLLPKGLGEGATIAHKTGSIGSLLADVGLIDLPTGKRYIAAVIVKRPREDKQAQELIRQVSRAAYQYFNQQVPTPNSSPAQSSPVTPFTRPNHN